MCRCASPRQVTLTESENTIKKTMTVVGNMEAINDRFTELST